jgi:hypothetical protein
MYLVLPIERFQTSWSLALVFASGHVPDLVGEGVGLIGGVERPRLDKKVGLFQGRRFAGGHLQ